MAHESLDLGVLHKRHRAAEALHRTPAIAAHDEGRHAAAVQIEDDLLLVLERAIDDLEQPSRKRLAVAGGKLVAHVDEVDLGVVPRTLFVNFASASLPWCASW